MIALVLSIVGALATAAPVLFAAENVAGLLVQMTGDMSDDVRRKSAQERALALRRRARVLGPVFAFGVGCLAAAPVAAYFGH